MNTKMIPVYLDCNYDKIASVISMLSDDSYKDFNKNVNQLTRCLSDELKDRYNGGSIKNINNLATGKSRLVSELKNIKSRLENVDEKVYESFRDYIEKVLNYNKPIDRSQYPHLTDEMIDEIYSYILLSGDPEAFWFSGIEDVNQRIDALKLFLSRCSVRSRGIGYSQILDAYISANSDDRKVIYDLLRYTDIRIWPNQKKSNDHMFDDIAISREKFDELTKLVRKGYDVDTLLSIYYTMEIINNDKHDYLIDEVTPISLKFGDLTVDMPMNELMKYCKGDKKWLRSPGITFDYLNFFSDNIYDGKVDDDTVILFNLNGIDFRTNPKELRTIIDKWKEKTYPIAQEKSFASRDVIHDTDINLLDFMCYLISECRECVHTYSLNDKIELDILGKKLNMTLWEFAYYFDENNWHFDVEKLINEGNLSESEYVYYNAILESKKRHKLQLTDFNILSNNKALEFFNEYGSVKQYGVSAVSNNAYGDSDVRDTLIKFCKESYDFTEDEAYIIMRTIDSGSGQCTMADTCNTIYELYDYDDEKFQNDFGYSMFKKELKRGANKPQDVINDEVLLLDLYIQANTGSDENGDRLFLKDKNGKISINEKYLEENKKGELRLDESQSLYFGYDRGLERRYDLLNNFLKSKNNNVLDQYEVKYIYNKGKEGNDFVKSAVLSALNENEPVSADLIDHYHMFSVEYGSGDYTTNGGHAVTLVGITEEGALVNSWGNLYYIPIDEIDCFYILNKKSEGSGTV